MTDSWLDLHVGRDILVPGLTKLSSGLRYTGLALSYIAKPVLVPAFLWAGLTTLAFGVGLGGYSLYSRGAETKIYDKTIMEKTLYMEADGTTGDITKELDCHVIRQGRQSEHYQLEDRVGISLTARKKGAIKELDKSSKVSLRKRLDDYTNNFDPNIEKAVDEAKKAFSERKIEFKIPEKPTKKEEELIPYMERINQSLREYDSIIKLGGREN